MRSVQELMSLEGRVALITGGAGHIGSIMAEAVAEVGACVVLLDCNKKACFEKVESIQKVYNVEVMPLLIDLAKVDEVKKVCTKVLEKFGRLDILVNCAAFVGESDLKGWNVRFQEQSVQTWQKVLEVNLTSIFVLVQSCEKALRASGKGSVINIGSIYGMVAPDMRLYEDTNLGNPAAYSTSKGGLLQLTRWLAAVLAPAVRVNAITIGGVMRNHKEPFLSRYINRTPLQRMATEEDIKGAVVYLASDLSTYVTGHNLVVDGGWTVW